MIRPLRFETERYGEYSKAGEFIYDHPFQWGSKRTGPDLAREGGLRSNGKMTPHGNLLTPLQIQQVASFVLNMPYAEGMPPEGNKIPKAGAIEEPNPEQNVVDKQERQPGNQEE